MCTDYVHYFFPSLFHWLPFSPLVTFLFNNCHFEKENNQEFAKCPRRARWADAQVQTIIYCMNQLPLSPLSLSFTRTRNEIFTAQVYLKWNQKNPFGNNFLALSMIIVIIKNAYGCLENMSLVVPVGLCNDLTSEACLQRDALISSTYHEMTLYPRWLIHPLHL